MPFRSQPQRLVPFSECKSTAFLHNHQTFFALFSRPFCEKYAHFMHKALKNSRFTPRKKFSTFLTADCKYGEKMWLLQENNMEIGPNMLNNIFIALRTPQSPRLLHKTHLVCQHFARLHAPCAQAAVEQNVDAVGTFFHGVGSFFHGGVTFSHGIYCWTGGAQPGRDAMKKNADSVKFSLHRIHFRQGRGQKKGDAT